MIRHIKLDKLCNFRDVGGYATADHRTVRWQRLYRAERLFLADLVARHGSVARYCAEVLRVGSGVVEGLRRGLLTEPAPAG
ncbi:tyrosine-protein phosphatase [Nonomuraea sp. NPDC005983]|uniref:tyrosine-protein phosphatase n=1 Tax=Nonomuraea sp. NPDC005983 TaxID=3155595 RepID=UPI0033B66A3F